MPFIDVIKRWGIGETEMMILIFNKSCLKPYSFVGGLPAQVDIDYEREELFESKEAHPPEKLHDWVFRLSNLEEIETVFDFPDIHDEAQFEKTPDLSGEEKRELGRLRTEKAKWDRSISAAVHATIFAIEQEQPIIRDKLKDELYRAGFKDVPDTTFDKIWKAIPLEYRHKGGAPKKNT